MKLSLVVLPNQSVDPSIWESRQLNKITNAMQSLNEWMHTTILSLSPEEVISLSTSVYHKPIHTERYIPFSSHHHLKTINGVLRCMKDWAHKHLRPRMQGLRIGPSGEWFPGEWLSCQTRKMTLLALPNIPSHFHPPSHHRRLSAPYMFVELVKSWKKSVCHWTFVLS